MSLRKFLICSAVCIITTHAQSQRREDAQRSRVPLQSLEAQPSSLITPDEFFRRAGSGLRGIEAERRNYWQPHITSSHRRILEAAALCKRHTTALVLGAGNCTEIPLEQLARQFDAVILVDLDEDSLKAAIENLPDDLAPKVHTQVQDVTTFAAPLMQRLWQLAGKSDTAEKAHEGLEKILDGEPAKASTRLPQADLVVSSLVLSELHRYPLSYASRLMLDRFGERLPLWSGYGQFRGQLQRIALQDHVSLLVESVRDGGAIYYADTIERGPLYENIQTPQRQEVLLSMFNDLTELGFFRAIQQQGPVQNTFRAAFEKMRARWTSTDAPQPADITNFENLSKPEQGAACETIVNLLCEERFSVDSEIVAFERALRKYAAVPKSFEPLVPIDAVQQEWQSRSLRVSGAAESWWWLEYPCSISYSSGAFRIRSWILTKS